LLLYFDKYIDQSHRHFYVLFQTYKVTLFSVLHSIMLGTGRQPPAFRYSVTLCNHTRAVTMSQSAIQRLDSAGMYMERCCRKKYGASETCLHLYFLFLENLRNNILLADLFILLRRIQDVRLEGGWCDDR
jgi:hypothetical protein